MVDYKHLIEARIRDFQRRKETGDVKPAPDPADAQSLETTLMSEIRALRKKARGVSDAEKKRAVMTEAQKLETQLVVLLETSGRPLAARLMPERLRAVEPDPE